MVSVAGVHMTSFADEYEAILARTRGIIAGLPPLLREQATSTLPDLAAGSFSRIVALLPYWVAELLDGGLSRGDDRPPPRPGETETLGLASFLGWGAYQIHDWLLDGELERLDLLPLALALHAAAVRLLAELLPGDQAFWHAFQSLSLESAEAHCWEQRRHFATLASLEALGQDLRLFDLDDLDRLAGRSAPFRLAVVAQLGLHGYDPGHRLGVALTEMLRHYTIARQIGDDHTDWIEDLRRGRLNYVSARVLRRMVEVGAVRSPAELDADCLAGYFLYDDGLFAEIQEVALAACQRAAQAIAPYHPVHLSALVDELAVDTARSFQAARQARRRLRAAFPPLPPNP